MKLTDYIQGPRKGKNAHRIELEAMRDPFLSDAIEGFNSVEGDHIQRIHAMQKRIKGSSKVNYRRIVSIAAGLLVLISIGGYFFLKENKPSPGYYSQVVKPFDRQTEILPKQKIPEVIDTETTGPEVFTQKEISRQRNLSKKKNLPEDIRAETEESNETSTRSISAGHYSESFIDKPLLLDLPDTIRLATVSKIKPANYLQDSISQKIGFASLAQPFLIKGKITDEDGEPIIGASIINKGTKEGTLSNTEGFFELQTNGDQTLWVNYIGYMPMEISVNSSRSLEIAMREDQRTLSEVVVTGYGISQKKSLTGSFSKKETSGTPKPVIGKDAYDKYIKNNLVHPSDKTCKNIRGKVVLTFRIDNDGIPTDIFVKESLCSSADAEAIRLVKEGPAWSSGDKEATVTIKF